ncbi:hypothetical protein Hanom_Chr08g00717161 [Helianthus anomalus]
MSITSIFSPFSFFSSSLASPPPSPPPSFFSSSAGFSSGFASSAGFSSGFSSSFGFSAGSGAGAGSGTGSGSGCGTILACFLVRLYTYSTSLSPSMLPVTITLLELTSVSTVLTPTNYIYTRLCNYHMVVISLAEKLR